MAAKAKTKPRTLDLEDAVKTLQQQLRALAVEAYVANQAQNAQKKIYDTKRGELLAAMKTHKLKSKIFEDCEIDGKKINLEAIVAAPETDKADVIALSKLVETDLFLQIVSATKENVVNFAGLAVFEQIKVTTVGKENVTVKPLK